MGKRNVKILLAAGLYPPEIGGPATYAQMIEQTLPEHGFTVTVVPYGKVRHLSKLVRHVTYARLLFKTAKDVDYIYALDPISVGAPAWIVSVLRRKPLLMRLGGDYAWEQGQQRFGLTASLDEYTKKPKRAPVSVRILAMIQRFVTRRASAVIVPSEYLQSIVASWGVKSDCLHVIYSALYPLQVEGATDSLRAQFSFDNFVITSVGRLVPWKGFVALVDVVKDLRDNGRDVSLVIAGDGPEDVVIKERIASRGLEDHVRLVGRLSKDALGATLKASDCFVLNTNYEGLSHQILEVMDLGVPVITTAVGGNVELIENGVSGLLVSFDDQAAFVSAIERIMDNESLRERLKQNARVRTQDFAKNKVITDLVTLLMKQ